MAEQNLDAARELIREERYDQARAILQMSSAPEARALLRHINRLERGGQRISPFRPPYLFMLLLGIALPLLLAYGLITQYAGEGGIKLPGAIAVPASSATATVSLTTTQSTSVTVTPSATPTQTASSTTTPSPTATLTFTPSATPTATRSLPPTWTPTSPPTVVTIDTTGTALAQEVATGEALVSASQTASAAGS